MQRYTIKHFNAQFPDDDTCLEWLVKNRWPEGITCPKCGQVTKHHRVTNRPVYACAICGHHVSPMAGTIMEHSSTSMRLWFYAMYLMASTRCGIAAKQLERELGVTYKTAWRMFKQIRSMLAEDITLEGSSVEIDATFVGGKAKNMHKAKRERLNGRGTVGKTAVLGMVERQGNVVTAIVGEESQNAVLPNVREKVLPSSLIYSDEHAAYNSNPSWFCSKSSSYLTLGDNYLDKLVLGSCHDQLEDPPYQAVELLRAWECHALPGLGHQQVAGLLGSG